ncbi:cytochrome c oxidase subunit II [Alicyclobacillus tolerans]|uniref:cytochrome c oxidase subunit II n=1 Tax=Alicyclobacillus tolerans TaxID=90970 RepID=UPI001F4370BD|nr:cytochrome c oxidase subunit II [Alicyclobacillus tolerans]MCF8563177.1 cytochrome c oxidase subunit II [Alicyclobacillus tolerans]
MNRLWKVVMSKIYRAKQTGSANTGTGVAMGKISLVAIPFLLTGCGEHLLVLRPAGPVAQVEHRLILVSIVLVLVVVIPVIALLFYMIWRYRDIPENSADYVPDWSESRTLEAIWWGIPMVIIAILGTLTVRDTYRLVRPPANSSAKVLTVHVTSLNWKWLFQYPEQGIATVNYCAIPANQPVRFVLTSNAPMNSFWVPQLGGQEYAMPGMAMSLWLQADRPGVYFGSGANFSGREFAQMKFHVDAKSRLGFQQWVQQVKSTAPALSSSGYHELTRNSVMGEKSYSSYPPGSFEQTVQRSGGMYMKHHMNDMKHGNMAGTD